MRAVTAVVLLVVIALLGGAAVFAIGSGGNQTALETEWVSDTARDVRANHHAVAAGSVGGDGMVYAPISGRSDTPNCELSALDAGDGSVQWRYRVPTQNCTIHSVATPALTDYDGDDRLEVLASTTEEAVVAFDARTGEEEFRGNLTSYGYSQPIAADLTGGPESEVAVVDVRGSLTVFDRNGSVQWEARLGGYAWGQPAALDADDDGETELIVGTNNGVLQMFEGDGSVSWRRESLGSMLWTSVGTVDDEPAVAVGTTDGTVALFDAASGETRWEQSFAGYAAVHAFGDGDDDGDAEVYAVANDGKLRSIDAATDRVEWTTTLTSADVQMMPPPTLGDVDGDGDEELVAPTNDGLVSLVDPADGSVGSTYERSVAIYTYATVVNTDGDGREEAYVIYSDGRVVKFEVSE